MEHKRGEGGTKLSYKKVQYYYAADDDDDLPGSRNSPFRHRWTTPTVQIDCSERGNGRERDGGYFQYKIHTFL